MPTMTFVTRALRLPFFAAAAVLAVGCVGRTPVQVSAASAVAPPSAEVASVAAEPAPSFFDLQDTWFSQNGGSARLASLQGRLLVVGVVNTTCGTACGTTLATMRALEHATDGDVHFVLVSLNPQLETPATLASFARNHRLPAERYTIIAGNTDGQSKLVDVLGASSGTTTAKELAASSALSVVDGNGVVVQQRGYGSLVDLIESLSQLLNIRN